MKRYTLRTIACSIVLMSCLSACFITPEERSGNLLTQGYRPVYGSQELAEIELVSSRPVKNPGKIYTYKTFLLINEAREGIHVFNNEDPEHPTAIGFVRMLGNSDMAIKDDVLYADHLGNLVALNIDRFNTVTKAASLPLQNWDLGIPPPAGAHFECIDTSKGLVIQWTKVEMKNPACYAIN